MDYSQTINRFTYLDAYPPPQTDKMVEAISNRAISNILDLKIPYHETPTADHEKSFTAFVACEDIYKFRRIPFGVTNSGVCFQCTIDEILKVESTKGNFAYINKVTVCDFTKADDE